MSNSGEENNKHWEFYKTIKEGNEFFNIDSKENGILRATGANFSGGANLVVSTGKSPTAQDSDKIWTVHYDEANQTYRFEAGKSGRFLYYDADGKVYNQDVLESNGRSLWRLVSTSQVLSTLDDVSTVSNINVFPNPAKGAFNITLNNLGESEVQILDMLGKQIFKTITSLDNLEIVRGQKFNSGIYFVKVVSVGNNSKAYYKKIILE